MWGLFLFEFIEGNTVTRVQFRRTLRLSRQTLETGKLTDRDHEEARSLLGRVTHFLDLPLFHEIIYCGAMRPGDWTHIFGAILVAVAAASVLTVAVPKLVRPRLSVYRSTRASSNIDRRFGLEPWRLRLHNAGRASRSEP
jgi:hypothetical protein